MTLVEDPTRRDHARGRDPSLGRPAPAGSPVAGPPEHLDEPQRLAALRRYDVLDTPPDGAFDRVTALAARLFDVPIALVSIVDEDRIWFKSRYGLEVEEIGRDSGLCASAILQSGPWIVTDAAHDPRTMANPLVAGALGLRFYLGVPLRTVDGHNLGTLCVIDKVARTVSEADLANLTDLAAMVISELEMRLAACRTVDLEQQLRLQAEELAALLQTSLLPPVLPVIQGVEIAAVYRPADRGQVGGDFYDVFPLDDRTWGVMIGDVCGKGAKAASRSALARYSLRAAAVSQPSPAAALQVVNQTMLTGVGDEEPFCSLVFALIEPVPEGLHVKLSVGGHPLPSVLRGDGTVTTVGRPGSLVGLFSDPEFLEDEVLLAPGDTLVLVTDGLVEIRTDHGMAGTDEFDRRLARCAGMAPQAIADGLAAAVRIDHDDVAVLALRSR